MKSTSANIAIVNPSKATGTKRGEYSQRGLSSGCTRYLLDAFFQLPHCQRRLLICQTISHSDSIANPWNDAVTTVRKIAGDPLFIALTVGYVLWGCAFIYQSSFIADGVRYFVLLDDEMISMRYARNLAHGFGLVFNPGRDRVEGFTHLAWV